jgi:hypothetical protein
VKLENHYELFPSEIQAHGQQEYIDTVIAAVKDLLKNGKFLRGEKDEQVRS